ncbi:MAG: ketopantoate reductase family protein [Gallicola sp.]|uniref:ketopantoate reductase family protein n=1 Tax=Gallicola sp. Sow4_E12 TaxID=3438785 RepID=UPI0017CCD438|nr:ketopantoate reductase family protein [Gallicola sp.]
MKIEKVGILGLGALGILYAEKLSKVLGEDLYILVDSERKERYLKEGVFSNGKMLNLNYLDYEKDSQELDLIIVSLKSYHVKDTLPKIVGLAGEKTLFISLLNGIDSEEIIEERFGENAVLYAVAQGMDATRDGRSLYYSNTGNISLGEKNNQPSKRLEAVKNLFDQASIEWNTPADIHLQLWSKLMLNAGINQVLALYEGSYEDFQKDPKIRKLTIDIMREVKTVANQKGIAITEEEIQKWIKILDGLDPKMKPSMAQDVEYGRKMEIGSFSGKICELGEKLGVPTPLNKKIKEDLELKEKK